MYRYESKVQAGATEQVADLRTAARNICLMHLLERVASAFNEANVPLLALKGAALNLTLCATPGERPMSDVDLLVRPTDVDRVCALLERLGFVRGVSQVREDFFPRFHYETEYRAGRAWPLKIDLHVRPFRPLRYAQTLPEDAFWSRAETIAIGEATVLVPNPGDMLIHLAAHAAVHGCSRTRWLQDIHEWATAFAELIDWDEFIETVAAWKLTAAVQAALTAVEQRLGPPLPEQVRRRLFALRSNWRDRLALAQAPRDASHPVAHLLVNLLGTPGWHLKVGYVWSTLVPDSVHMGEWYGRRHRGWLACAHLLRLISPVTRLVPKLWNRFERVEVEDGTETRVGVYAARAFKPGERITGVSARPVESWRPHAVRYTDRDGQTRLFEITGQLRVLRHDPRPSARIEGFELRATRPIKTGHVITIDYHQDCGPGPVGAASRGPEADPAACLA